MKSVLFIAYAFPPEKSVAALRIHYWARELELNNDYGLKPIVITASPFDDHERIVSQQYFVENKRSLRSFINPIKDPGISWSKNIKYFLNSHREIRADYVVISGGPFMQFGLVKYFQKKLKSKVILDFRDPFAINPRFRDHWLKISIKKYFENRFVTAANKVISVNETCVALLGKNQGNESKFGIIPNGFDETVVQSKLQHRKDGSDKILRICYPGKYYSEAMPDNFLRCIKNLSESVEYVHIGPYSSQGSLGYSKNINETGPKDYGEVIAELVNCDLGVIFTKGDGFESSTKIFDYLGCGLKILVITEGLIQHGEIHNILSSRSGVFWCKNNENEISSTLQKIISEGTPRPLPEMSFARKVGLKNLVSIINEL